MAAITDIAEANKMIDDLRKTIETKEKTFSELNQKHSELISANTKLITEKQELWDMVASGKSGDKKQKENLDDKLKKDINLDEMDM